MPGEKSKKYIVWTYEGYEGWSRHDADTLSDAVKIWDGDRNGDHERIITKPVKVKVKIRVKEV